MLHIMLIYLFTNAVCLYNAFFIFSAIDFCKCFLFSCFVLVCWHTVCFIQVWFCIMHSALNLLAFPNSMFNPFYIERAMCSLEKLHLKVTIITIIIIVDIVYWHIAHSLTHCHEIALHVYGAVRRTNKHHCFISVCISKHWGWPEMCAKWGKCSYLRKM